MKKLPQSGKSSTLQRKPDEPKQPDSHEQSGSTGRRTGTGDAAQGKEAGEGRYGQSGFGGPQNGETPAQANYRKSGPAAGQASTARSNPGSGRSDQESEEFRRHAVPGQTPDPAAKPRKPGA